jgi:TPR repeat protein
MASSSDDAAPAAAAAAAAARCALPSCGAPGAARCAACKAAFYCGADHQRAHWKAHKLECQALCEAGGAPALSWEQRVLAEAHAAAPASLAAKAALPPIPAWANPPTPESADAWRKAAEGGHSEAQTHLGYCFDEGKGVAQDEAAAVAWYAKAAAQGNDRAQYNVGRLYHSGKGVAQDDKLAFEWYAKAAAQGFAEAQFYVGNCFSHGMSCVTQDTKAEVEWFTKAAAQGHAAAQCSLGACYYNGTGIARDYNAANEWFVKSVQGSAPSQLGQFNLGVCYEHGNGVAKDLPKAAAWFNKAATGKHAPAAARRDACLDAVLSAPEAPRQPVAEIAAAVASALDARFASLEAGLERLAKR